MAKKEKKSRIESAQEAYKRKDLEAVKKAHTKAAIQHQEAQADGAGTYVGDFVYGAIDGSVTTFAVVSGVAGAALSSNIIIILGFANLLGDGISMAMSNYLGAKSEREFIENERKREYWEIEHYRDGEVEEIRQIFKRKGFRGKQLDDAVKTITADKKVWVETMMMEELKLIEEKNSPAMKGGITFISFCMVGFIPLLPYVLGVFFENFKAIEFQLSVALTFITFFLIGSAKTYVTGKSWWKSGFETLLVGGLAAAAAYIAGYYLGGLT